MTSSLVSGYAAMSVGRPLEPFDYPSPEVRDHEVRVEVTHCGVCYTDVQGIDDHYGISTYPFVPGHEIVGRVSEVGSAVVGMRPGDRVGIGWQGRSCMRCPWCLAGEEQLCDDVDDCGTWRPYGGFADSVVVDHRFAYPLPAAMPAETAAVLMCAGVSVYAPLSRYAPGGAAHVAVVGVGGLGHVALQMARAMGCRVTAISSSPAKEDEARGFGAQHFIVGSDRAALRRARLSFDLLLYTSHGVGDWTPLVDTLTTRGRMVVIGFPDGAVALDPMEMVVRERSISGSLVGNRATMRAMLAFAHAHGVAPQVERLPMSRVNDAIERLRANEARYRIVLARA